MPGVAVYLVRPAFIASIAACFMKSGVSKSGSPAAKLRTSTPWAISSFALEVTAIVADGGTARAFLLTFMSLPFM